jgi:hypothetical protein
MRFRVGAIGRSRENRGVSEGDNPGLDRSFRSGSEPNADVGVLYRGYGYLILGLKCVREFEQSIKI